MSFAEIGYRRFSGLLDESLISEANQTLRGILDSLNPESELWNQVVPLSDLAAGRNPEIEPTGLNGIPFILGELPGFSEFFRDFVLRTELWDAAAEILQSSSVIYHFSNITRKPARIGPNLSWHRDYPNQFICPEKSAHFFRALVPLGTMNSANGCTQVIPGTHLVSDGMAMELKASKTNDFGVGASVDLAAEAGDMIAIHSKIVHGGRENRSGEDRDLVVVQFGVRTDAWLSRNFELFSGLGREEIVAAF